MAEVDNNFRCLLRGEYFGQEQIRGDGAQEPDRNVLVYVVLMIFNDLYIHYERIYAVEMVFEDRPS